MLFNGVSGELVLDVEVKIFVLVVTNGMRVGLIDRDDVFDIVSDVIDSTSQNYQLHYESTLFVLFQMQHMLCLSLPVKIIVCTLGQINTHVYLFRVEDILYPEFHL